MIDLKRLWIRMLTLGVIVASGTAGVFAQADPRDGSKSPPKKKVLVELFTSQGCDMCPDAERLLGSLAEDDPGIVPVALHVDYFNDPWVDPFSDRAFSRRQGAYNGLYRQPKNSEYGIYYTPMLMIDGKESVNGRDRAAALAAIRRARASKPAVVLDARLGSRPGDPRSGTLDVGLASPSPGVAGRKLLVGAMVRQRSAVTRVGSGENARKDLTNRYPARAFQFQYVTLKDDAKRADLAFPLRIEPSWDLDQLDVIAFVQDNETGVIHQAEAVPWSPDRAVPASQPPGRARVGDRPHRPASGR